MVRCDKKSGVGRVTGGDPPEIIYVIFLCWRGPMSTAEGQRAQIVERATLKRRESVCACVGAEAGIGKWAGLYGAPMRPDTRGGGRRKGPWRYLGRGTVRRTSMYSFRAGKGHANAWAVLLSVLLSGLVRESARQEGRARQGQTQPRSGPIRSSGKDRAESWRRGKARQVWSGRERESDDETGKPAVVGCACACACALYVVYVHGHTRRASERPSGQIRLEKDGGLAMDGAGGWMG